MNEPLVIFIAKATENLDFGCTNCSGPPKHWEETMNYYGGFVGTFNQYKQRRCCMFCAKAGGYTNTHSHLAEIKKKYGFDKKRGFWTSKGCRLPREERSHTCLTFQCDEARKNQPDVQKTLSFLRQKFWQTKEE